MRIFSMIVIIVFFAIIAAFALENLNNVTVSLFGWRLTAPLAALVVIVYFAGMVSGGSVISFVKHSVHRATTPSRKRGH